MDEKEKLRLKKIYSEMPEEELSEMLIVDENEYKNGVYQLLLEAAKLRGWGTEKREISNKSSFIQKETKEQVASQSLTSKQKKIFTIFPGLAFWYLLFTPKEYKQKQSEANRCQCVGLRNYLIVGLIFGILMIFDKQVVSENKASFIFTGIGGLLGIIGISIYLHFRDKKQNKKHQS